MKVRYDPKAILPILTGPRVGILPPEQEKQYQVDMAFDPGIRDWRQNFEKNVGGPPNTDTDPSFDYRKAWAAGDTPRPSADGSPHWGSAGKAENHPTRWKAEFMDKFGEDPDAVGDGRYTPEMKEFIRAKIASEPILDFFAAERAARGEN